MPKTNREEEVDSSRNGKVAASTKKRKEEVTGMSNVVYRAGLSYHFCFPPTLRQKSQAPTFDTLVGSWNILADAHHVFGILGTPIPSRLKTLTKSEIMIEKVMDPSQEKIKEGTLDHYPKQEDIFCFGDKGPILKAAMSFDGDRENWLNCTFATDPSWSESPQGHWANDDEDDSDSDEEEKRQKTPGKPILKFTLTDAAENIRGMFFRMDGEITVVAERTAVSLLTGIVDDSGEEVTCLERGEEIMRKYMDPSEHWLYRHTALDESSVQLVREFLSPPSVFFLEPGDLFIRIQKKHIKPLMRPPRNSFFVARRSEVQSPAAAGVS